MAKIGFDIYVNIYYFTKKLAFFIIVYYYYTIQIYKLKNKKILMRKKAQSYTINEDVIEKLKKYAEKNGSLSASYCVNQILSDFLSGEVENIKKTHIPNGPYIDTENDKKVMEKFLKKSKEDIDFENSINDTINE